MYGTTIPTRPIRPSATARPITPTVDCGRHADAHSTRRAEVIESIHALTSNTTKSTAANTAALPMRPKRGLRKSSSSQ